jgi:hypothetical protein
METNAEVDSAVSGLNVRVLILLEACTTEGT